MREIRTSYYLKTFFPFSVWSGGTSGPIQFKTYEEAQLAQVKQVFNYFEKAGNSDIPNKSDLTEHDLKIAEMIVTKLRADYPHLAI